MMLLLVCVERWGNVFKTIEGFLNKGFFSIALLWKTRGIKTGENGGFPHPCRNGGVSTRLNTLFSLVCLFVK